MDLTRGFGTELVIVTVTVRQVFTFQTPLVAHKDRLDESDIKVVDGLRNWILNANKTNLLTNVANSKHPH